MDDPVPVAPEFPEGAWKEFCYDRQSFGLPAKDLAELAGKRQRDLVSVVLLTSGLGTGFTVGVTLSWSVGLPVMVGLFVLAGIIIAALRAERNGRQAAWEEAIEERRGRGDFVAALSRKFIGLLALLGLAVSVSLSCLLISEANDLNLEQPTPPGAGFTSAGTRFTTPSGRCSAELPGEPTYQQVALTVGQWRVLDVETQTSYLISEINPADVRGAGLSAERFLELSAETEVNHARSQSEFFRLERSELVGHAPPTFDLRYTLQLSGDPRTQNSKRTVYGPDGYACSVVLTRLEASPSNPNSFLSSVRVHPSAGSQ